MMKNYKILVLILVLFNLTAVKAQFSGSYAPASWGTVAANSDGLTYTTNAPTSIYMTSGNNSSGSSGTNDFTITVPQSGFISFSWAYSTVDGASWDYPQVLINGSSSNMNGYSTSGGSSQSGTQPCFSVTAGQVIGFRMYTVDNYGGAATTTISNFGFTTGTFVVSPTSATVCPGATLALTASGGTNFTWTGGITNGVAFTPTASQVYTVTSGSGSCASSKTVGVTYNPPLAINGPTGNLCINTAVTLTATGGTTYSWSTGGTSATEVVTPTANVTYTVFGTSNAGCNTQGVKSYTVDNGIPVVTASTSAGTGVCPGKTLTVSGIGATNYTWTGGSPTVTNNVSFSLTTSTSYTVTGGNACGTATAALTVSIHPTPSVTPVASSSSLCSGSSLTLTGVGNATAYAWSGGGNSITNGAGFNPPLTTTYTVIGTSALSCTASATIPVTVVATPSAQSVVSPTLICLGKSSTLTASGATSYTWTNGTQTGFTNTFVTTPSTSGVSTYTIIRANSTCTTSQVASLITNALPVVFAIVTPTLVCALQPATLAVAGGQTYTWTSPGMPPTIPSFTFSGASPLVYPPVSSVYTVAAHDGTCVNTTTVALSTNPNPTVVSTANPPIICSGQTATVNATGGSNYTITSSISSATLNSFPISQVYTTAVSYVITGDNSFGCTNTVNQVVVVNPNPVTTASVVANKTLVCSGGTAAVNAGGANTYSWSSGALTQSTIVTPISTVSGPVIFTVTGTYTSTGCHSDKTVAVSVFIPTLTVTGNTSTCFGGVINLTAGGGTGNNNYRWYTVPGSPATSSISSLSTTLAAPAVYTLTGLTTSLTAVLCPATKTVDVNIFFNPTITAVAQRTVICTKESVVLTAGGGDTYLWNTGPATQTISVSPNSTTSYTVTGTDINGCVSTGTVQVKVSGCAGVGELNAANLGLSVYPNPTNGEFTIQTASDIRLTLVNDLGQLIRVFELSGNNSYKVSVNDLSKGIYFLTGQKDNVLVNQKIVITK